MNYLNFSLLTFAYLLGSINSAIIVCYIFRLPSPRSIGSGNPGTTNVLRIGGKVPAAITLVFDILKGLVPVLIAKMLTASEFIIACTALYAILGHVFPIFFGFKGGKGVATLIGTLFGFGWVLGLIFVITWLCVALITKYSSLAALVATVVASISVIFMANLQIAAPFLIIAIMILIKHKGNIQRLISGQESKIGDKAKAK
ncbi:glycerol-3-phosphate 1-O-acyltransferase PlsY [Francisella adeliensis]|uniref:Glycerol-3-phosphate acyltransferase n=1 Tax=Francisella adeliensis TaxID=2007306 RepID=A0A2Z4XYX5_9GAMM|nr:glycerol-3-phosphate 1-O-acyltransferase PlsY [Francisella adeliensis]AXA34061.1 acyl-phosphate glycerol 3-phosphate acyltransferase [Francisella adeliensis]MBK2085225.1 glycerol-3-phosphate 1-O-acyltransferase PlsY [Francisella adeliensis]MBK2096007.1 glycerol-3-phosphate 1-O-acyltransferase PlsY [Francisella adeliensis]QIW12300.1 glycerol-3-phosphate 1-O-acyltransferase PlsY [Francisella adeliensis]QIW14174.1 glycerol-3-phosphate 1-O-acyltransferase PlsY [Francisella adeliensis]